MKKILTILVVLGLASVASAGLTCYSQDFEGMNQADPAVLGNDGWLVYGNVFGLDWNWWYGYGAFPAPNGGCGFCAVAAGQGGPSQGAQQLVVYSDYCNGDHPWAWVEANVFQEQVIGAADVGSTWTFDFDVKKGDLQPASFAMAFIKTIDPASGWAMTNFLTVDTHTLPQTWSSDSISIAIDAGLVGQFLQIGFLSTATNYNPSGMLYDNINFAGAIDVQVDIKPGGCPNPLEVKGRGKLSVAVVGSADFDVHDIDAATIELEGVGALRSKYVDVATPRDGEECECTTEEADGFTDLLLKFDRPEVIQAIGAVSKGEEVSLTLTGNLLSGYPIEGADCVVIRGKPDPAQHPTK